MRFGPFLFSPNYRHNILLFLPLLCWPIPKLLVEVVPHMRKLDGIATLWCTGCLWAILSHELIALSGAVEGGEQEMTSGTGSFTWNSPTEWNWSFFWIGSNGQCNRLTIPLHRSEGGCLNCGGWMDLPGGEQEPGHYYPCRVSPTCSNIDFPSHRPDDGQFICGNPET